MTIISKDGKEYPTVKECLAADQAYDEAVAAENLKKETLKQQKEFRKAEVEEAYKVYVELLKNYLKDYHIYKSETPVFDWFPWNF